MNCELLRRTRNYKGYTQDDMALDMKISKQSYSEKELGKKEFKRSEIENIIKKLDLSIEETIAIFLPFFLQK